MTREGIHTEDILGFSVAGVAPAAVGDLVEGWLSRPASLRFVAAANPHSLVTACRDAEFREALKGATLLLPDGVGILLASLVLRGRIRARVTGMDFFLETCRAAEKRGGARFFFLGARQETLDAIAGRLAREFPRIEVAGLLSPPFADRFSEEEDRAMTEAVRRAKPDVLWVGMTAPKQEKWIHRNRVRLEVPLIGAVGAVFDYYSGRVPRPPAWARRLGLEWLLRLVREPRRLWRRNLLSTPVFLWRTFSLAARGRTRGS